MMSLLNSLSGYKTYVAAAGLFGLAAYQASQGQIDTSAHTVFQALAAAGIRHAITKASE